MNTVHVEVSLGDFLTTSFKHEKDDMIRSQHQECWTAAKYILATREFCIDGKNNSISVDWSVVVARLDQLARDEKQFNELVNAGDGRRLLDFAHTFALTKGNNVEFTVSRDDLSESMAKCLVEYFLYDLFLMMNISSPASCNLFGTTIAEDLEKTIYNVGMSNLIFEVALLDELVRPWLPIQVIPLQQAVDWFLKIRVPLTMVPHSRMDRVLIAMMQITKSEISEMTIIWIFFALESLLDAKIGQNLNHIFNRLKLLFSLEGSDAASLKAGLRQLYDLRSAIVHGGYAALHPISGDHFDKNIVEPKRKLEKAVDLGCHILISSLQMAAKRGITELSFVETMVE